MRFADAAAGLLICSMGMGGPLPTPSPYSPPMTAPRRWPLAMAAALLAAGCSNSPDNPDTPDAARPASPHASAPPSSGTPTTLATPTATSAFCLDLNTFQVGVVTFRSDVGAAIDGKALDFEDLRTRAVLIAHMGKEMKASAPQDIAEEFRVVLKAIETSASRLKEGTKVRDVVDPLFGEQNLPAFDAVNDYDCDPSEG